MLVVFVRTILIYFIVLFVIRMMGKAELSKMSPFQMVVVFMIAELATIPIESPEISLITGTTAIFTLMFIQILISLISLKNSRIKTFFSGKPSIIINKGKINYRELKSLRITLHDLTEQLRLGNASSISDVEYAIMEANGDLSIILKSGSKPITPNDISVAKPPETMPAIFISDGIIYEEKISSSGWTSEKLQSQLADLGFKDHTEVFLAFCDSSSSLHVYRHKKGNEYAEEVSS